MYQAVRIMHLTNISFTFCNSQYLQVP